MEMSLSISFSRRIPLLLSLAVRLCAEDKTAHHHQLWSEMEASVHEGSTRSPSSTSIMRGGELTLAQSDILDEKERQHISGDTRVAFQKKVGLDHVYDDSKEQRHTLQSGTVGNRNLIRNDEFFLRPLGTPTDRSSSQIFLRPPQPTNGQILLRPPHPSSLAPPSNAPTGSVPRPAPPFSPPPQAPCTNNRFIKLVMFDNQSGDRLTGRVSIDGREWGSRRFRTTPARPSKNLNNNNELKRGRETITVGFRGSKGRTIAKERVRYSNVIESSGWHLDECNRYSVRIYMIGLGNNRVTKTCFIGDIDSDIVAPRCNENESPNMPYLVWEMRVRSESLRSP